MPLWLIRYGPTLIAVLAVATVLWLAYGWAWDRGHAARDEELIEDTARLQAQLNAASEALRRQAEALEAARAARTELERRLADEASDDPLANSPGLGADSLRRLDRIR